MANAAEERARFPLVVGFLCTLAAAVLVAKDVLPAKREHDALTQLEAERKVQLRRLLLDNRELRNRQTGVAWDPEAVLLEIDRLGLIPEELVGAEVPEQVGRQPR